MTNHASQSCGCTGDERAPTAAASSTRARTSAATFQPGVDIIESAHEYTLRADVPGATADSVDVSFEDGILSVRAAVAPRQQDATRFLIREYGVGDYERSFRVRGDIDADKISAEIKHGVLTLRLPKSEEARPRKIAVASNN
ncbi:MAG: Hsp20/alpha crystallin family protein [Phycisphaerales bacterium]